MGGGLADLDHRRDQGRPRLGCEIGGLALGIDDGLRQAGKLLLGALHAIVESGEQRRQLVLLAGNDRTGLGKAPCRLGGRIAHPLDFRPRRPRRIEQALGIKV